MTNHTTHKQHPIGTGFTPASTAADVIAGIDLTGKYAVVTGGASGIGLETTRALAGAGATVVVGVRNPAKAKLAVDGIPRVEVDHVDLLDPATIDAFAARRVESGRPLHILVNNAGVMAGRLFRDARGYESQFATNHLGHFHLTLGLLPALRAARGARVVNVTSGAYRLSDIRWDDPNFTGGDYDPMLAYGQSKTANVLFAVELDRRWAAEGIRGYAVHPGIVVTTNLGPSRPADGVSVTRDQLRAMGLIDEAGNQVVDPDREMKTPQMGASTSVFAATSPLLSDIGGVSLKDNDISPLGTATDIDFGTREVESTVVPHAVDPDSARRLWGLSERLIGMR